MKRFKRILSAYVTVMLLFGSLYTVCGEETQTFVDEVVLTGRFTGVTSLAETKLIVLYPGKSFSYLSGDDEDLTDIVAYVADSTTTQDGRYEYIFGLADMASGYTARVTIQGRADYQDIVFNYSLTAVIEPILEDLRNSNSESGFISMIENNKEDLGLFFELENMLNAHGESTEAAYLYIYANRSGLTTGSSLLNAYRTGMVLCAASSNNQDIIKEIFENYPDIISLENETLYEEYEKIDDKDVVYKEMAAFNSSTKAEYIKNFNRGVIYGIFEGAAHYSTAQTFAANYAALLESQGFNMSDYNSLSDKSQVFKNVINGMSGISGFNELIAEFNRQVSASKSPSGGEQASGNNSYGSPGMQISAGSGAGSAAPSRNQEEAPQIGVGFDDLGDVSWAQESILALYERGIVSGKGGKAFAPGDLITREEISKIVIEAFFQVDYSATSDFHDVSKSDWFYPYVSTAQKLGIIKGSAGNFMTGVNISRQDLATVLYRAISIKGIELRALREIAFFDEYDIQDYAKEAVMKLAQGGVINGIGNNMFAPENFATRAEAAKMVYELIK